jgi:hypothetical protein
MFTLLTGASVESDHLSGESGESLEFLKKPRLLSTWALD